MQVWFKYQTNSDLIKLYGKLTDDGHKYEQRQLSDYEFSS